MFGKGHQRNDMALKLCKTLPKDYGTQNGRPLCRLTCDGKTFDIGTGNMAEIERGNETPQQVKWFIGRIWETLALPGCSIDAELLRYIMDFESAWDGKTNFWDRTCDVREYGKKICKRASSWVLEEGIPSKSHDLMDRFFRSKLGILLLRGFIDLPSMFAPNMKGGKIPTLLLDSMDKQFTQSALCCLYVNNMTVELSCPTTGKSTTRGTVKFERSVPELLADFASEIPAPENLEKVPPDAFMIYGQLLSGYVGCLGDFYSNSEEFEARKRSIEDKWKAASDRDQWTGQQTRNKHKWFDNFAGTDDFSKAALKMILTDCPPISLWASLSNIKRNLVCLAYMCKVFLTSVRDNRSSLYSKGTDDSEVLSEMAEFVCSFFTEDASLALTHNFPLRISKQNKVPYLSIKDYTVKPIGGLGSMQFLKRVQDLGVSAQSVMHMLPKIEGKSFLHVPFYNGLSKCEMSHQERVSLTDKSGDDNKSLVLVPIKLGSWEQNACCKFSAGIKTGFGSFSPYGVYVGKSSVLFDKSDGNTTTQSADEKIRQLAESYKLILQEGMSSDEAASVLSLTLQQKEKVMQYMDSVNEGPAFKKMKYS
jgi:hypothetical protein